MSAAASSLVCGFCGEELASVATLTSTDSVAHLLPDDPVIIQNREALEWMHKRCAMKWVEEKDIDQLQLAIPLTTNCIKQGGVRCYFPPDTRVAPVIDNDRDSFHVSLGNESDRGCVLVAAAFIDHVLADLLCTHFSNKETGERLVRARLSPLGTFSSRIMAAFALGLLTESEHKQLEIVRRIRNDFAHEFANVRFSESRIKERVQSLPAHPTVMSSAEDPTRVRFESAVNVLLTNLRHRLDVWASQEAAPITLPWWLPCDGSGVMKISDTVELAVDLRDPWLMSLADRVSRFHGPADT